MSKIITESGAYDKAAVAVNKAGNKLVDDIQVLLASAMFFAVKDGNTTPMNALIHAVGKGIRKTAMADWLLHFAPVVMNDNKETAKDQPFKFSADKRATLLAGEKPTAENATTTSEAAYATHWTAYKEPPLVPENWSLTDAIKKLVVMAQAYQTKGTKVAGADLLGKLSELTATKSEIQPV